MSDVGASRSFSVAGRWLLALGVAAAVVTVLTAWAPARTAPYHYDDHVTPQKDPASQSLVAFAQNATRTLRPLTKLTFALESSLGATEAPARRLLHIPLFLGCVLLLAALARAAGVSRATALLLATIWGVHPAHGEMVIALAGRSVLLGLVLLLASALALLSRRHPLALGLALLAVLARETNIAWLVLCALFVLDDAKTRFGGARMRLTPLLACALGVALLLASARLRELLSWSWADTRALDRLGLQVAAIPEGLWRLCTSPTSFAVDMDFSPVGVPRLLRVLAGLAAVAATTGLALSRRFPLPLRVGAALWLALTLPTQSLVPKLDPLTARTVSASSAAVVLLFAAGFARAAEQRRPVSKTAGAVAWTFAALLVVALATMTRARAALYQDPVTLWRDAAEQSTSKTRPLVNVATLLAQRGQLDEAHRWLQEAARRRPHDIDIRERLRSVEALQAAQGTTTPHVE